jgi:hypothetical protein
MTELKILVSLPLIFTEKYMLQIFYNTINFSSKLMILSKQFY